MIGRRQLIRLVGGAAVWPLAARAQSPRKLPTIGFFSPNRASAQSEWTEAFVQRLRELDWMEGRSVSIEYRWAEGRTERLAEIAAELVRLKVDVIVTQGGGAVLAAKQATSVIPIIFAVAGDPVATGLVASLARPGGNVTGLSMLNTELVGKRLELLREVVPNLRHLAIIVDAGFPDGVLEMGDLRALAATVGLEVTVSAVRRTEDIVPAFDKLTGHAEALYVVGAPLLTTNRTRISSLAIGARLPTVHNFRQYVDAGGLISYGPNFPEMFRRAGELVDKILRGAKPAEIPVEQPTKFDLVVNLVTAKALGLTVPPTLLARADEVIE